MFTFASILTLLEQAPAAIDDFDKIVADAKALLDSPDVKALEAHFSSLFTVVTTPGAAAVVEPIGMKK